jgi:acyl-coenzyme A thioesterase PaaI-like protein
MLRCNMERMMNLELTTGTENLPDGVVDDATTPENPDLVGLPVAREPGYSRVELRTRVGMTAEGSDFVRGAVVFELADQAAMLALDEPSAVLEAADVRFVRPVGVDQLIFAEAHARMRIGKRRHIAVTVSQGKEKIFEGDFTVCVTEAR